jgi:WD40 repeat protein
MSPSRIATACLLSTLVLNAAGADPPAPARVDLAGDPLPPGAIARLGTTRYRMRDWGAKGFLLQDGSQVLWMAQDKTVTFTDVETGKATDTIRDAEVSPHRAMDLAPDGRRLAQFDLVRSDKGQFAVVLRMYDLKARKTVWEVRPKDSGRYGSTIRFTPDGRRLLTLAEPGDLRIWDAATGDELRREKVPGNARLFQLSPDGKTVALWNVDLYVWDWEGDRPPRKIDLGGRRPSGSIQFAADGKTFYFDDYRSGAPKGYDVATGRPTGPLDLGGRADWFSFSPDGKTVAVGRRPGFLDSGDRAGGIVLRDLASGKELRRLTADPARPWGAQWSKDGSRLASFTSHSHRVCVWDVKTGKLLGPDVPGHDGVISAIAFAPDGRVFTSAHDRTVRAWDPATGKLLQTLLMDADWVPGLAISPDGSLVAASALRNDFQVWDTKSGKELFRLLGHGQTGGVRKLRFSADEQFLLSWGDDWYLRTFDTLTGKLKAEHRFIPTEFLNEDDPQVRTLIEFSGIDPLNADLGPDGKTLVVAKGKEVFIYAADTGKERFKVEADPQRVDRLTLSADGKLLATAGPGDEPGKAPARAGSDEPRPHQVTVWDMATAAAIARFRVPTGRAAVMVLAFTPDGRRLVTASWEPGLRFWDAKTGDPVGTLDLPHRPQTVAFDPDGKRVAVGFLDTTALVYDLEKAFKPAKKE